jgi:hypothetical protein
LGKSPRDEIAVLRERTVSAVNLVVAEGVFGCFTALKIQGQMRGCFVRFFHSIKRPFTSKDTPRLETSAVPVSMQEVPFGSSGVGR